MRWMPALMADLRATLLLFTRIPLPMAGAPAQGWAHRGAWAWPLAGALVGMAGAIAALLSLALGLPALLCAILAILAMVLATGALHEDGLADFADGLGGGRDRSARLRIMRDSHLGSYGALALVLATSWRIAAVAALLDHQAAVLGALIACAAAARWSAALLAAALPPANPDGQSAAAGRPAPAAVIVGLFLCRKRFGVPTDFMGSQAWRG